MASLTVVAVTALLSIITVGMIASRLQTKATEGWAVALDTERQVRYYLTSRITTLENRLQAQSFEEFKSLQSIPGEMDKAIFAETNYQATQQPPKDDYVEERMGGARAEDLEGDDDFAYPTIG